MKGHKSVHHGKHHGVHHYHDVDEVHHHNRKDGGRIKMKVSGNPDVFKEEEGKEPYAKGDERKRGGRAKHRKTGGKVLGLMTGGAVRPRLDRPGRKRGGAVGADQSPLSTAFKVDKGSPKYPKEEEGGQSPE